MQAAELFSQKHFSEVVQHEEFMLLSQSEVEKLIKCDEIQVEHTQCSAVSMGFSIGFAVNAYNCCISVNHMSKAFTLGLLITNS